MAKITAHERRILKRSDVSGTVPTIPASPKDPFDHTINYGNASGWTSTDLYVGELFLNTVDDKIWVRMESGIKLLDYSGSTSDFIDLDDTPSTYSGQAGKVPVVDLSETGMTFSSFSTTFAGLDDVDGPLETSKLLVVNSDGSGITYNEFSAVSGLTSGSASVVTEGAIKSYVDAQVGSADTLGEVLALGNTTDGTDIVMNVDDYIMSPSFDPSTWYNGSNLALYDGSAYLSTYNSDGSIYSELFNNDTQSTLSITSASTQLKISLELNDVYEYITIHGQIRQINIGEMYYSIFDNQSKTADRTYTYPNQSGTFAMLTDVPSSQDLSSVLGFGNTSHASDVMVNTDTTSVILAGYGNTISGVSYSEGVILGGGSNEIIDCGDVCLIGASFNSVINKSARSSIINGSDCNIINSSDSYTNVSLIAGNTNNSYDSENSAIVGGINNILSGATRSVLLGGQSNYIKDDDSVILGGLENEINNGGYKSAIIAGEYNEIFGVNRSVILGGDHITATEDDTVYVPNLDIQTGKNITQNGNTFTLPSSTGTIALTTDIRPYSVYTALISQSSTNDPTVVELENDLGTGITYSRTTTGVYVISFTTPIVSGSTTFDIGIGSGRSLREYTMVDNSTINFRTDTFSGNASDGLLNKNKLEVRVYN